MANYVKFMRGTQKAYEALLASPERPNVDTLYFISDSDMASAKLYLGEKLIAGSGSIDVPDLTLGNLTDIALNDNLQDKAILVYDKNSKTWIDSTLENAISVFIGASINAAGIAGLVPAPELGKTNLFLRSDGNWADIGIKDANIWTVENEDNLKTHMTIINETTADILLSSGDIIVIKDIIMADKYQHTAYVYTGSNWAAMDGNYNAENVYFNKDFVFTENIGAITVPASGNITVEAAGKNIKEFLSSIFSKETYPSKTLPSIKFTTPSSDVAVEVGEYINPSYVLEFNKGEYTYDDDTEVSVQSWEVTDSKGNTATSRSGSFDRTQMIDSMIYTISAKANYNDGIIPHTNLGNEYPAAKIVAGTTEEITSKKYTSYRKCFYGVDASGAELTSEWIRTNLTSPGSGNVNRTITWKASDLPGVKRFIIAIPTMYNKVVKEAIITSSMNAKATDDYIKQNATVSIEGANGYLSTEYNIWIYEPASIAETEIHEVSIG